jgi:glycosyltransferase involved in cell wall biosynthesis
MKISVVTPTYNRINSLQRMIRGLEKQTFPADDFEVIVVSDGSSDGTIQYLKQLCTPFRLVAVEQPNGGPAAARNKGIELAQSEIILFLDDDIYPAPQLIEEHVRVLNQYGENLVVLGPMLTPTDFKLSSWVEWEQKMLEKQYQSMSLQLWKPTARQFYTGNSSIYRRHLLATDGFDPAFKRAEDVELAYRLGQLGLQFFFNHNAIGYHYAQRSFASWMNTAYVYGHNDVIFHINKGQTWLLPTIKNEFFQRHRLIQVLIHQCVDRPILSKIMIGLLKGTAIVSNSLRLSKVTAMSLSGIFNLRYYQGISDQLGGWKNLIEENFYYAK